MARPDLQEIKIRRDKKCDALAASQIPDSNKIEHGSGSSAHWERSWADPSTMSASLIGRLGQALSGYPATPVSMSPAGSCFSSDSAQRPFQYGIREWGNNLWVGLTVK